MTRDCSPPFSIAPMRTRDVLQPWSLNFFLRWGFRCRVKGLHDQMQWFP